MDPKENVNGYCTTKIRVDNEVLTACPIVIYALRVEVDPGWLELRLLMAVTAIRLVIGGLFMTDPMFWLVS